MSGGSEKKEKKGMSVAGFELNKTMLQIAMGFSLKRIFSMADIRLPKKQLLDINKKLNKIKKRSA